MLSTKCIYKSYIFDIYMYKQDLTLNNCNSTYLMDYDELFLLL